MQIEKKKIAFIQDLNKKKGEKPKHYPTSDGWTFKKLCQTRYNNIQSKENIRTDMNVFEIAKKKKLKKKNTKNKDSGGRYGRPNHLLVSAIL